MLRVLQKEQGEEKMNQVAFRARYCLFLFAFLLHRHFQNQALIRVKKMKSKSSLLTEGKCHSAGTERICMEIHYLPPLSLQDASFPSI